MNYQAIEKSLADYPKASVGVYLDYLRTLETETDKDRKIRAWWYKTKMTEAKAVNLFEAVAKDGLFIDGKHITLNYKSKIIVTYDYQAYKNKMLMVYPESIIDLQIVKQDDKFSFAKRDGRVVYDHKITSPFVEPSPENIAGAYCIIKNNRGEFLELLGPDTIQKMRNVATTDNIWKTWYDQMVLKSVIKRACKRHFDDVVSNMEKLDNENYDLSKIDECEAPDAVLKHIDTFTSVDELLSWAASEENSMYHNDENFRNVVKAKKVALKQDQDPAEIKGEKSLS